MKRYFRYGSPVASTLSRATLGMLALLGASAALATGCLAAGSDSDADEPPADQDALLFDRPGDDVFRAAADCNGCRVLNTARLNFSLTGVAAYSAKLLGPDQEIRVSTVLADGSPADERELLATERARAQQKYGTLTPELWHALQKLPPTMDVTVWIWVKVSIDFPEKEALLADPARAQRFEKEVAAKVRTAAAPVLTHLAQHGHALLEHDGVTPLIRARVPAAAIQRLAAVPGILVVGSDEWPGNPLSTIWHGASGFPEAQAVSTGAGQRVCVKEEGRPDDTSQLVIAGTASPDGVTGAHIRWTTGIIRNTSAIDAAPDAEMYIANWDEYTPTPSAPSVDHWCTSNGGRTVNFSWTFSDGSPGGLSGNDMRFDFLTKVSPYPLFVPAAGNSACTAGKETVHHRGFNSLVVGGSNDRGTASTEDDTMYGCSAWKNPTSAHSDREFPYAIAPAVNVTAAGKTFTGTSGAAPQATGTAALMAARDSSFNAWPEMKRAVILATSTRNVDGGLLTSVSSVVDHKDGVGHLDAGSAVALADPARELAPFNALASSGRYMKTLSFASDFLPGGMSFDSWNIKADSTGRLRVAIAWDGTATCDSDASDCTADQLDADLDLKIYGAGGAVVCGSTSFDSSWEVCDMAVTAGETFQARIHKASSNASNTYFSIAWFNYVP
jgi:Subtilase family